MSAYAPWELQVASRPGGPCPAAAWYGPLFRSWSRWRAECEAPRRPGISSGVGGLHSI